MDNAQQMSISEEAIMQLVEAFNAAWDAVVQVFEELKDAILTAWNTLVVPCIRKMIRAVHKRVVPHKLYHLAYHSKKCRVRKKNMKRLYQYLEELQWK